MSIDRMYVVGIILLKAQKLSTGEVKHSIGGGGGLNFVGFFFLGTYNNKKVRRIENSGVFFVFIPEKTNDEINQQKCLK